MAANGVLYTYPENFRAFKALIAAQYSGAKVSVDNNFVFGETNKTDAFLKKFPLGKVPAFETSDGKYIFESNAIAWAVSNEQLRGKTPMDQAQVVAWMNFADNEILPASCTWVFPCLGIMAFNKNNTERAKEDVRKALGALNTHLLTRTFLVGERISLADITVSCTLLHLYQYVLEPSFRKSFQNCNRWFTTIINQPQVKAVIGDFKLCEKMAQFDGKKFAEVQGKLKQSGGEKKEKKENKKEQKKKEEQPKKEKKEEKEASEPPSFPKSKDPLDALPAGLIGDQHESVWDQEGSVVQDQNESVVGGQRESVVVDQHEKGRELDLDSKIITALDGASVVEVQRESVIVDQHEKESELDLDSKMITARDDASPKAVDHVPNFVYFDLETTGLDSDCDIVQLSAVIGKETFNQYMLPSNPMSWHASEVTGLTMKMGSLFLKNRQLEAIHPKEALQMFIKWLKPFSPVALVAHNCHRFDSRRLLNVADKLGLKNMLGDHVVSFVDSIPLFKGSYPDLPNYKLQTIVSELLSETFSAHDAVEDVQALQRVIERVKFSPQNLLKHSFSFSSLAETLSLRAETQKHVQTLSPLIKANQLSPIMAEKMGKVGISFDVLRTAYVNGGKTELEGLLSRPSTDGQPLVTRHKGVISKVCDYFVKDKSDSNALGLQT